MGCLCSKEDKGAKYAAKPDPQLRVLGAAYQAVESRHAGVKLHPSAAAFPVQPGKALQTFLRVVTLEEYLFASLFEGYGGPDAAKHLHNCAQTAFTTVISQTPEADLGDAFSTMMYSLEQELLQAGTEAQAKASSGASAVVAVISLRTNRLQAVSVGGGMCVVAHTSGSFKQALTEALAVADGRKARPDQQALRGMLEVDPEAVHASAAHTFGYGAIKGKEAEKPWPALQCEVGSWSLSAGDDCVLLLSSGLLDLLSCTDAAVLAHLYGTAEMQSYLEVGRAGMAAAAGVSQGGAMGDSLRELPAKASTFNLAGLLVHQAAAQTATVIQAFGESQAPRPYLSDAACICISTEFPKSFTSRQLAKQRTNMWLSRSLKTAPRLELSRGGAPPGADAAGAAGAATATPSKASAGGAGGRTSEPGARTFGGGVAAVRSAPGSAAGSMGGAAAAGAAGPAGGSGAVAEVVEARPTRVPFRWRLVAQYMSFMSQRRRGLRQRWYATYQQLMAMADAQARQAELVTWQHMGEAVQVTRTGKVMRPGQAPARPPVAPQHFASAPSPGRYASSNASVSSPPKASTVHSPSKATAVGESRLSPRGGEAKGAAAGAVPARLRTGSYNLRSGLSKASGTAAQGDSSVVLQVKSPTKGSPVKAMNRAITASPRA